MKNALPKSFLIFLLASVCNTGCAIKAIVVDRHTLMEAESAGQWPDVDKKLLARTKKKGAMFFPKEEIRGKIATPYQVLNSEPVPKDETDASSAQPIIK